MVETIDAAVFWTAVPLLALGTFLLRYLPLRAVSERRAPPLLSRALAYVPAAVLPAMAAPLLLLDEAGAPQSDPAIYAALLAAIGVGAATRHVLWTILAGMGALWATQAALTALA